MPILAGHSIVENGYRSARERAQVLRIFVKGRLIMNELRKSGSTIRHRLIFLFDAPTKDGCLF
jgi:hypothetical protein